MTDQTDVAEAETADRLSMAAIDLCNISYARDIRKIPRLVQQMPPLSAGGSWNCMWGPAQSPDHSNLVFVAGSYVGSTLQRIFVTIRGTDIYVGDPWGVLKQIIEDLDAFTQVAFPAAPAHIASGSYGGLQTIQTLTARSGPVIEETLLQFLQSLYSSSPYPRAIVTGHSLGGCLATVVALWMKSFLPSGVTIQPITFAAPTAGDQNFANQFDNFSTALQYQNSLDIIPLAFQNLFGIDVIYLGDGLPAPDDVLKAIVFWEIALDVAETNDYVQPAQGMTYLSGVFDKMFSKNWPCQAWQQHHPTTYRALMLGQQPPTLSCSLLGTERTRLAERFGSAAEMLKRARLA
jgi:triacylglycerol lipase